MSQANFAPEKIDDRKRGSPSQGDSYVSVWPCSNPYLSTSWTSICSTQTLWRVKLDADESQLQRLQPKQKNNLRCQRLQMPYIQSMLDQTSPSSEALPLRVLSQWNDHLVKESATSSLGQKMNFKPLVFKNAEPDFPPLASHFTHLVNDSTILFSQSCVLRKASNCSGYNTVQLMVRPPLSNAEME